MNWQTQDANMSGNNGNNDQSKWMQALSMAALSNGADANTMLGFATGRLISNLVNDWIGNRNARNDAKAAEKLKNQDAAGRSLGNKNAGAMAMAGNAVPMTSPRILLQRKPVSIMATLAMLARLASTSLRENQNTTR